VGLIPGRALSLLVHLAIALFLTVGCARLSPVPDVPPVAIPDPETPPGSLFDADLRRISLAEMADKALPADYVLIGESHTNPCDHRFQEDALSALVQAGIAPGLGLEMVPWSKQDVLDAYNRGELPLDRLEENLQWADYWGYSFTLYQPVLERAKTLGVPLVALNVPKDLQNEIRSMGMEGLFVDQAGLLPPEIIPPDPEQTKRLEKEYLRHVQMPRSHDQAETFNLQRFLLIQSLWDTQMAYAAATWRRAAGRPMVILAGSGHVEYGHGIARRLTLLDDNPRILSITPWRKGQSFDPAMADMRYYCPEVPPPRLGLVIAWKENQAVLSAVLPESRAEKAGLMAGDVLLKAGDVPVDNLEVLHRAGHDRRHATDAFDPGNPPRGRRHDGRSDVRPGIEHARAARGGNHCRGPASPG